MARGRRRRAGQVGANDVQRIATAISDVASRLGLECTVSTGTPLPPQVMFLTACADGDVGRLKALVDSMDEDDRESLASVRMEGFGPLHEAARRGNMGICRYLVEQLGFDVDADANNRDSGVTPLSCAVSDGKEIAVRYFLDKGADPNKKDSECFAPLHDAAKEGQTTQKSTSQFVLIGQTGSNAIKLDPADAALHSNRSLCHLKCGEAQDALLDANACIRLRPEWPKGYYRKGAALMSLKGCKEACDAFMAGVKLDPANEEMQEAFWGAAEAMKKEHLAEHSVSSYD